MLKKYSKILNTIGLKINTMEKYDIVVGICTLNVEQTIERVTKTVDIALNEFFPKKKSLIICSDGFSTDKTKKIFEKTKTKNDKLFIEEIGEIGKGSAIRTIFLKAREYNAKATALVDGDLESLRIEWINLLIGPVLDGYDFIIPNYSRDKDDGVLTKHLVYPVVKALFRADIRQPIGGEHGFSLKALKKILEQPNFPNKFGVDIFITIVCLCEGMKIIEAGLGIREHFSTKSYKNPDKVLIPMFNQVVGEMFKLTENYKDYIKKAKKEKKFESIGEKEFKEVRDVQIDLLGLIEEFRKNYKDSKTFKIFSKKLIKGIESTCFKKQFDFPVELWVESVYFCIKNSKKYPKESLESLRVLWKARFASFVIETAGMKDIDAEKIVDKNTEIFIKKRGLFFK